MKTPFEDAANVIPYRPAPPLAHPPESFWELYERIAPVAVAYRKGGRYYVQEFNSSRRLLKTLWRLGREQIEIRGLMSGLGSASPRSTAALNCYLVHLFSQQTLRQLRAGQLHRFTWHEMQRTVPIEWRR